MPVIPRLITEIIHALPTEPGEAADVSIAILHKLSRKLSPLIGPASVHMLVSRSIELNRSKFSWLGECDSVALSDPPYKDLRAAMKLLEATEVSAVMHALLSTYTGLLSALIGTGLTEQFVRAALVADSYQRDTRSQPE